MMVMHKQALFPRNPFTAKSDDLSVGTGEHEKLIDLLCNEGAQEKFKDFKLAKLLVRCKFLLYDTSEKCNYSASCISMNMKMRARFSAFLTIKSITRNPLVNSEHKFRCSVSNISLRLAKFVEEKQAQLSH